MLKLARGTKSTRAMSSLSGASATAKKVELKTTASGEGKEGDNETDPSLNEEQNHNAKVIMEVGAKLKADPLAMLAAMETALAESTLKSEEQVGGGAKGVFQMEASTASAAGIEPYNVEQAAKGFFEGYGNKAGGAIELSKAHPNWQAYEIAQAVQKSGAGAASNGAANYGAEKAKAEAIIKDFGGVGAASSLSDAEKPYEFAIGSEEDYWQGSQKVAGEVQWNLWFGDGDILYYWNSLELILREAIAHIDPIAKSMSSDIYVNPATGIRVKGSQVRKYENAISLASGDLNRGSEGASHKGGISTEVTLQIFCQPGFIRAGDVVILTGAKTPWYNNGYRGRWVVLNATRSIFNAYTEVTLGVPGTVELPAPLAEPEQTTSSSSGKESEGAPSVVDAARRALRLQKNNPSYYEYEEARPMPPSLFGSPPIKIDCSTFATLAYKAAGLPDPNGLGYNGSGNTVTLQAHGTKTNNPQPGDLAFFGSPEHVVVYVGGGKCISMGEPGDPIETTIAAETAAHGGSFLGYRTYGAAPSSPSSTTVKKKTAAPKATDNLLQKVSKRQLAKDLTTVNEESATSGFIGGGDWTTGRE